MKVNVLSHNYTGHSLVVVFVNDKGVVQTKMADSTHYNWAVLEKHYIAHNFEKVVELIDVAGAIQTLSQGKFAVRNGSVYYNNEVVKGYLFEQIITFISKGIKVDRLLRFAENLWANPSEKARQELYKFLEHKKMPITDDGCFLAYKGVRKDFYSISAGTIKVLQGKVQNGHIFNGVGETIEVERSQVNNDASVGCSTGLHAGSFDYANEFKGEGVMMIVKINPKDVVSVPNDCNFQKLRTCKYEVIAEEGKALNEVKNINFDKVAKLRYHSKRDASGKFCK